MTARRRVCVVTGSRADYGHLAPIMRAVAGSSVLDLRVIATGTHLSPEFGLTYRAVEADGFPIDARVETLLSSDTGVGIAKSIGLGVIGFADAFDRLSPDLVLVLGDRFETLAAAQAALVARLPLAHVHGGDVTEGAYDEAIRHAVTKMAHLHFTATEEARRRVIQLGEDPGAVFAVGSPSLDGLRELVLSSREELERELGLRFRDRNLLVTHHPVTLRPGVSEDEFAALLTALDGLGDTVGILLTHPNADNEGRRLIAMIEAFVAVHPNAKAVVSLGRRSYFSAIATVDVVVGNSSSGLCEVPSFAKPTVNIGDRQRGRTRGASVIDVPGRAVDIAAAIRRAWTLDLSGTVNPYGDGRSAARIVDVLERREDYRSLLLKRFHDLPGVLDDRA